MHSSVLGSYVERENELRIRPSPPEPARQSIQIFICNLVANENSLEMHSETTHYPPPASRRPDLSLCHFGSDSFAERLSDGSYQIIYKLRLPGHAIDAKASPRPETEEDEPRVQAPVHESSSCSLIVPFCLTLSCEVSHIVPRLMAMYFKRLAWEKCISNKCVNFYK